MRTTLTIDDDVLSAARAIARRQHKSVGEVLSALVRTGLHLEPPASQNGIPLLPMSNPRAIVTLAQVNALRDGSP